jgi:DNA-binding response OmpR family regulator
MATVLIATGDSRVFEVLAAEAGGEGHRVLWAADGKEAYDMALSDAPDLVMLDSSLPVFDAFETCSLLRGDPTVPADLPVFVLSDEDLDRRRLEKVRLTGRFAKSHGASELREFLTRYLDSSHGG